jgi:hypothetical protein
VIESPRKAIFSPDFTRISAEAQWGANTAAARRRERMGFMEEWATLRCGK